jgi:hypothetical protein
MRHLCILLVLIVLSGCGMSLEEKERSAAVTCAEVKETRGMDGAPRVRLFNEAREAIGEAPYLEGDEEIKRSITWGTCELLVLNDPSYESRTSSAETAYLAEEARKSEDEARIREQEYQENLPQLIADSTEVCKDYMGKLINIEIEKLRRGRISNEQKLRTFDSVLVEKGIDAENARLTSLLVDMYFRLTQAKVNGATLSSVTSCYDETLPENCEDLVLPVLAKDYRPEGLFEQQKLVEAIDQCQIL